MNAADSDMWIDWRLYVADAAPPWMDGLHGADGYIFTTASTAWAVRLTHSVNSKGRNALAKVRLGRYAKNCIT
jgi:hypothetical protein